MKLCWDNIEDGVFTKNGSLHIGYRYFHIKECIVCGENYISNNRNQQYCGNKCHQLGPNNSFHTLPEWKKEKCKSNLIDFTGKTHSKEVRQIISNKLKGRIITDEWRQNLSKAISGKNHPNYGKHLSDKTKKKISDAHKGKIRPRSKEYFDKHGRYEIENIATYDLYADRLCKYEDIKRDDNDSKILNVRCAYCGKWYIPKRTDVRNRLNVINGRDGYRGEYRLYCSNECKQECPTYGQKLYPKGFKPATSREVQPELRQMVLKRDGYKCIKCGSEGPLHCHHVEGIRWNPLESADIDGCITVCKPCHKTIHKIDGCKYNDMKCKEVV